jgi:hypothetical protein
MATTDHQYSKVELFRHSFNLVKVLAKLLLTFRELSTTLVVRTEATHDTINDQKFVFACCKRRGK